MIEGFLIWLKSRFVTNCTIISISEIIMVALAKGKPAYYRVLLSANAFRQRKCFDTLFYAIYCKSVVAVWVLKQISYGYTGWLCWGSVKSFTNLMSRHRLTYCLMNYDRFSLGHISITGSRYFQLLILDYRMCYLMQLFIFVFDCYVISFLAASIHVTLRKPKLPVAFFFSDPCIT